MLTLKDKSEESASAHKGALAGAEVVMRSKEAVSSNTVVKTSKGYNREKIIPLLRRVRFKKTCKGRIDL